ncbi:hypothetical protein ABVK25_003300 [Lepraria finkii]|uniref:Uncharacterized protein n=1 Tax=Lepraria finkii TaxID=1340010 RepID=A0ABR4BEJ9_9LECA
MGHRKASWITHMVEKGQDAHIFSQLLPEPDHESPLVEKLAGLEPSRFDTQEDAERKLKKLERYNQDRCCTTSHCVGDEYPLEYGKQTLFVNASVSGSGALPVQRPWLVDVELPRAR